MSKKGTYYERHKEEIRAKQKEHYEKNRESINRKSAEKYEQDKENRKTYYLENRDKILRKMADKREAENKSKRKPYDFSNKTPDDILQKQGLVAAIEAAPKFREYIRQLIKEYEEKNNSIDDKELDQ